MRGTANEQMVITISRFLPAATQANASGLSALGYFFSTTAVIYPGSFSQNQVWCAAGASWCFWHECLMIDDACECPRQPKCIVSFHLSWHRFFITSTPSTPICRRATVSAFSTSRLKSWPRCRRHRRRRIGRLRGNRRCSQRSMALPLMDWTSRRAWCLLKERPTQRAARRLHCRCGRGCLHLWAGAAVGSMRLSGPA